MKLIKEIHDLINLAIDKGVTDYIPAPDIDNAVDQGQILLYRQLVKDFAINKRIRNDLLGFEKLATVTMAAGIGVIPGDFENEIEVFYTSDGKDYSISIKESGFYRRRLLDVVSPPDLLNPMATINNNAGRRIEVAPSTIASINLRYWILPVKPFYAETTVLGQRVYDDGSSVDVGFTRGMLDILIENTLKILGLNLREFIIAQAGQAPQPKVATL